MSEAGCLRQSSVAVKCCRGYTRHGLARVGRLNSKRCKHGRMHVGLSGDGLGQGEMARVDAHGSQTLISVTPIIHFQQLSALELPYTLSWGKPKIRIILSRKVSELSIASSRGAQSSLSIRYLTSALVAPDPVHFLLYMGNIIYTSSRIPSIVQRSVDHRSSL